MGNISLIDNSKSPHRIIWALALPAIIQQLLQTLVQYIDTAMVGRISVDAAASIAVNTSTIWLFNGILNACGVGFSVLAARHIGANDAVVAKRVTIQSFLAILFFGLFTTAAALGVSPLLPKMMGAEPNVSSGATMYMAVTGSVYIFNAAVMIGSQVLRCAGDTRSPMIFNILTNILNVAGNYFLIFPTRTIFLFGRQMVIYGAGWGLKGAAISTAVSTAVSGICILLVFFVKNLPVRISVKDSFRFDKDIFSTAIRLGLPNAFERVTLSLGQVSLTTLVAGVSTSALAAHQFALTAESISYLPVSGFAIAATALVAQSLGAKQSDTAYRFGRLCVVYGVLLLFAAGGVLFGFSERLISFFTSDTEVIFQGALVLRIVAFAEPFFALSNVISGILRGAGDTKWPFYISVIGMWGIRITLAVMLIKFFNLGLMGGWIAMVADLIIRGSLCFIRFKNKKWLYSWRGK